MHFDETFRGSEIECVCMYVIIWIRFSFYNKTNLVVWNVQNCLVIDHINQMSLSIDPNATNSFDIIFLFLHVFCTFFQMEKKVCVFFPNHIRASFHFGFTFYCRRQSKKIKNSKKVIKLEIILVGTISEPHLELGFMNILLNFQKWRKKTMDFPWGRRAGSLVFHRAYFFIRIESILSTFCS